VTQKRGPGAEWNATRSTGGTETERSYHIVMQSRIIKQLMLITQRIAAGEPVSPEEAAAVVAQIPLCQAPGCGVGLYRGVKFCSPDCRNRATRDAPREAVRRAASAPLDTYTLEER